MKTCDACNKRPVYRELTNSFEDEFTIIPWNELCLPCIVNTYVLPITGEVYLPYEPESTTSRPCNQSFVCGNTVYKERKDYDPNDEWSVIPWDEYCLSCLMNLYAHTVLYELTGMTASAKMLDKPKRAT